MAVLGVPLAALAGIVFATSSDAAALPRMTVDPGYGPPLTIVKVVGHSFCTTCGPVTIFVSSLAVDRVSVGADGGFSRLIRIPGSTRPGPASITAKQADNPGAEAAFEVTIDQPAPTTYPAPASIPPPGNLPSPSTARGRHSRSAPPSRPSSTAPGSASGTPSSSSATGPGPAPTNSPAATMHSTPDSAWPITLGVIGGVVIAGTGAWLLRRRRATS